MEPGALHQAGQPGQDRSTTGACAGGGGRVSEQRRTPTSSSPHSPLASHSNKSTKERPFRNLGDRTMKNPRQNTRTQRPVPEGGGGSAPSSSADAGRRTPRTPGRLPPHRRPASPQHPTPTRYPPPSGLRPGSGRRAPPGEGADPALPHPAPRRRGP